MTGQTTADGPKAHDFCCGPGEQFMQQAEDVLSEFLLPDDDATVLPDILSRLLPVVLAYGDARAAGGSAGDTALSASKPSRQIERETRTVGQLVPTANPDHQPVMTGAGTPPFCTCGVIGGRGTGRPGDRPLLADHLRQYDPTYGVPR